MSDGRGIPREAYHEKLRLLLKLLESRPRARGSKRSLEELLRLAAYAKDVWSGWEELGWVKWKGNVLKVRRL